MDRYLNEWQRYVRKSVNDGNTRWIDLKTYAFYRGIDSNPELATAPENLPDDVMRWRYSVSDAVRQGREFLPQGWTAEDVQRAQEQANASWQNLTGDELWASAFSAPDRQANTEQRESPINKDWQELNGDELWEAAFKVNQ